MQPIKVGNITSVDGASVKVLVTAEDLVVEHEGEIHRIGQLGSYVTVPLDANTLVGMVTAIERQMPVAADVEPPTVMAIQLLGTIRNHVFHRGVNESPTVGDDVWVAAQRDFEAIFGTFDAMLAGSPHPRSFTLGKFASDTDFEVKALGKEFFSKHVAVMGNSGAGKSCCTAKVLQEVLELPESQVIMFDMHGEYRRAFSDEDGNCNPNVTYLTDRDLVLPYWLLRYEELDALFVDRNQPENTTNQESFLKSALTEYRRRTAADIGLEAEFTVDTPIYYSLEQLKTYAENLNDSRYVVNTDQFAFSKLALRNLKPKEQEELMLTQRCDFKRGNPEGETPHALYYGRLLGLINKIDTRLNDRRYDFLLKPIQQAKRSPFFRDMLRADASPAELSGALAHLIKLMTGRMNPRKNLTIIDLSALPFDIVDVTVAVVTRILFDFNFWCPPDDRHPLLLAYEEAHNYIPREPRKRSFARLAVERVAKEGRKYGVSAMIISQRPSELSETVLAQCNSMLVLRLNNPDDQEYVTKVVSDQFASLVRMLPVLRPGEGFVIGDAVLMPMRTLIDLPRRLPQSGDVDYFKHWSLDTPGGDTDGVIRQWWTQHRGATTPAPVEIAPPVSETPTADLDLRPPVPDRAHVGVEPDLDPTEADAAQLRRKAAVTAPRIRQIIR